MFTPQKTYYKNFKCEKATVLRCEKYALGVMNKIVSQWGGVLENTLPHFRGIQA